MAVLAVVGRILLGIFIFLLAVILLLLFFPISYEVTGELGSEEKSVTARVRWLFGFVRFWIVLPKPATPMLKVLWFSIMGKKDSKKDKGKKQPKKKGQKSKDEEKKQENESDLNAPQGEQASEANGQGIEAAETAGEPNESASENAETIKTEDENSSAEDSSEEPKKRKKKKKEKKSEDKKPKSKKPLKEKISELIEEIKFYKALWEDGNTKPFVQAALAKVLHLLKNLLPRKIRGKILFGAASPDVTGYAYGGYTVLKSLYPKRFKAFAFTPDFERQILEGELFIKGWFMLFTVIRDALRILLDKRFKILRKKWKAHKNENNKSEEGA